MNRARRREIVVVASLAATMVSTAMIAKAASAHVAAAGHPSALQIVQRSRAAMASVTRVHSAGTAALWASGTNGSHIPSSTQVRVTGDCVIARTSRRVVIRTRLHAVGTHTVSGRVRARINQRYIAIVSGGPQASSSAGQQVRIWERAASTQGRWRVISIAAAVQRPAYFLGSTGLCPNDRVITLIGPARFTYVGATVIDGMRVWHVHGTRTTGDTTTQDLYIDPLSSRWIRVATTLIIHNNGKVVNRLPSTIDYSQFNGPIRIDPPTIGATSP